MQHFWAAVRRWPRHELAPEAVVQARRAAQLRRIVVIGPTAAGKSTISRALGDILGLPVVNLDRLYWRPDWTPVPAEQFLAAHREAIARERWICDGNYCRDATEFRARVARSELVVVVWQSRALATVNALLRTITQAGARPEIGPEYHQLSPLFLWRILTATRSSRRALRLLEGEGQPPIVVLHGHAQAKRFVELVRGA